MTVGDRLREILKSNGMRQKDLADSLHVSESTVQKWIVNRKRCLMLCQFYVRLGI